MTRLLAALALLLALAAPAPAQSTASPTDPAAAWADATAALVSITDPHRPAPPAKARAIALKLERLAALPALTDHDRARVLVSAARAHEAAGDAGHTRLALRRAQHLYPALPGLADRLTAAPASHAGAPPPVPTEKTPGDSSLADHAAALALSIPRRPVWLATITAWLLGWSLAALPLALPRLRGRGLAPLAITALATAVAGGSLLATHLWRDRANTDAVVLEPVTPRAGPDTLTFPTAAAELPPGAEVRVLETRPGSDDRPWARVQPLTGVGAGSAVWVPASTIEPVIPRS
jgi:hypothetical protein